MMSDTVVVQMISVNLVVNATGAKIIADQYNAQDTRAQHVPIQQHT